MIGYSPDAAGRLLWKELELALKKIQSQLIVSNGGYWSLSNVLNMGQPTA